LIEKSVEKFGDYSEPESQYIQSFAEIVNIWGDERVAKCRAYAGVTEYTSEESEDKKTMRESIEILKSISKQNLTLSISEISIGAILMITGIFVSPLLSLIGFGSASLGLLHLAWSAKPK
jgi:hypothetical protein